MPKFNKSEEELETHFEKWLFVLKNLHKLTSRPARFQEKIFSQIFKQAEIAQFDEKEFEAYKESLKVYRDLKNVQDTAFDNGKYSKAVKVALGMKQDGLSSELIKKYTGLTESEIEKLN